MLSHLFILRIFEHSGLYLCRVAEHAVRERQDLRQEEASVPWREVSSLEWWSPVAAIIIPIVEWWKPCSQIMPQLRSISCFCLRDSFCMTSKAVSADTYNVITDTTRYILANPYYKTPEFQRKWESQLKSFAVIIPIIVSMETNDDILSLIFPFYPWLPSCHPLYPPSSLFRLLIILLIPPLTLSIPPLTLFTPTSPLL